MEANVRNNVKGFRRSKEDKKVLRKQIKASHTLLKHEGISTASQPTKVETVYKQEVAAKIAKLAKMDLLLTWTFFFSY